MLTPWEHVDMSIDLDFAPRTERVRWGLREPKSRKRWFRVGVASVVVAALIVGANLYYSPAHAYDRSAHQAAWLAAVQSLHGPIGCSSPTSAVSGLAGGGPTPSCVL